MIILYYNNVLYIKYLEVLFQSIKFDKNVTNYFTCIFLLINTSYFYFNEFLSLNRVLEFIS